MTRWHVCLGAVLLMLVLALGGCQQQPPADVPEPPSAPAPAEPPEEVPAAMDIVDTAVAAGSFGTLVAAVQAADLVDVLKSEGPFTVFAPTDEAFAKLPAGTLDDLLKPESKEKLTAILTYHVVAGKVMAADVVGLTSATTVNGADLTIAVEGDTVMVDGAKVVQTDIECSNGVIHVIDAVVVPAG
jgi:transforming growth factor-beta-induced protein